MAGVILSRVFSLMSVERYEPWTFVGFGLKLQPR